MFKRVGQIFCIFVFLISWAASASAAAQANWCVDSDYADATNPYQAFDRKLGIKAEKAATKTDCVEMRSKSFLVKEAVLRSASNAKLGVKATRLLLCNFDRLFFGGIARYAAPPIVYKDVERETKTLLDTVKNLGKKVVDPRKDALEDDCDNSGWNEGSKDTLIKREIDATVSSNASFFLDHLCNRSPDTVVMPVEKWAEEINSACKARPGEINDPEAWRAAQEAILEARGAEGRGNGGAGSASAAPEACTPESRDRGVIFSEGRQATAACTYPGRIVNANGSAVHYCPSRRVPGPSCGTYFALLKEAQEACTYPGGLRTPEGAVRYYCPPKQQQGPGDGQFYAILQDAQFACTSPGAERIHGEAQRYYCPARVFPGPDEGEWFANQREAMKACTRPGAERMIFGATRYYCPAKVSPGPNTGRFYASLQDAQKACTRPGAESAAAGATRYYCPAQRIKPGPLGMMFALESEARANCTRPGAELTHAGSTSYFCPEARLGIYRAKIEDLAGCKNVVAELDRAGSTRYFCRNG